MKGDTGREDAAAIVDVDSFMEFTECKSRSIAESHLKFCGGSLNAAVDRYFATLGADPAPDHPVVDPIPVRSETVRDPIPARSDTLYSDTLYHEDFYGASSSTAGVAPSIWSVNREPPSRSPVYPMPGAVSMPETNATVWGSDEYGSTDSDEKEETNIADKTEQAKEAEEDHGNDDKEAMEDEDGAKSMELEEEDDGYDGIETEYSDDDDQDDGDYLESAETDHMEALEGQPAPRADKMLDDLFRPPYEIMFGGSFHEAKVHAARKDQWLLMNIQSSGVFASHLHNRDLWSNEVVVQVIKDSFVFSLLQKTGRHGDEAGKVCCFYKLDDDQLPAVLVLDPITGQLLDKWCGIVQHPDDFLTSIGKYTESKPSTVSKPRIVRPIAAATPQEPAIQKNAASDSPAPAPAPAPKVDKIEAPAPLPKVEKVEVPAVTIDDGQPMEGEAVCKLRVRFHTGNMVTKEFGSTRTVAVLFAYCRSVLHGQAGTEQAFRIMRLSGQGFKELLDDGASFEDLKLNRDTVTVVLDN